MGSATTLPLACPRLALSTLSSSTQTHQTAHDIKQVCFIPSSIWAVSQNPVSLSSDRRIILDLLHLGTCEPGRTGHYLLLRNIKKKPKQRNTLAYEKKIYITSLARTLASNLRVWMRSNTTWAQIFIVPVQFEARVLFLFVLAKTQNNSIALNGVSLHIYQCT